LKTLLSLSHNSQKTTLGTYLFQNLIFFTMTINKDKLEIRKKISSKRLETTWRKPKGVDNHQRKQKSRGRPGLVKVGYGGPKISKGLHPSGYTDNLVHNLQELVKLDPKIDGVRLGHSVGTKKRKEILKIAIEKKFKVFNARVKQSAS
jgi:large subunit ribosomal protein L32e